MTHRGPCGKKSYLTRGAAVHAALGSSQTFGKPIRIYHCTECNALHLTTKTKPRRTR